VLKQYQKDFQGHFKLADIRTLGCRSHDIGAAHETVFSWASAAVPASMHSRHLPTITIYVIIN